MPSSSSSPDKPTRRVASRRSPTARASGGRRTGSARKPSTPGTDETGIGGPGAPARNRALRSRGQQTLRRLLDAGIEVFARRGYHAARVDDIVKAARTSHGTFYLYFANKEDLFQALVADASEQLAALAGALPAITPDDEGRAALRGWLARFTEVYEHYGPVVRTWTEAEVGDSELGQLGADVLGGLSAALAEHLVGTDETDLDRGLAGLALLALIERFNYFVLSGQVDAHRDEMLDTLSSVVHDALHPTAR